MIDTVLEPFLWFFDPLQQMLFARVIEPLMLWLGLDSQLEDGYRAATWLAAGLLQLLAMLVLIRPLERWRPVETEDPAADPGRRARALAVRTDVLYTLIHRLGLFRAALFLLLDPLWAQLMGHLRVLGLPTWHLDAWWPGISDQPLLSFITYLVAFDGIAYGLHRLQHRWGWWWQLHALHHSQRHMTMWSDNRNHLLDDLINDSLLVIAALLLGVAPSQFIAIVMVTQLLESLSHANVRLSFGRWGEQLLVSPRFHRRHHGMEPPGAAAHPQAAVRGYNYAVLFPVWDRLFGSLHPQDHPSAWKDGEGPVSTGIRDQLPEHGGREYGQGFWAQQWLGLRRLAGRA